MKIHKVNHYVDYNCWLKRLDTQLKKPTNENSSKTPKLLDQRIRKLSYTSLGTSVMNRTIAPLSLYHLALP